MNTETLDESQSLMLDGNAIAGMLFDLFGVEMTLAPVECAACGSISEVGRLWAFIETPGYVIRCPDCLGIIMRLAVTPRKIYLDARGASYLCIPRRDQA